MSTSSKVFCIMPWINLATETNGKCKICCVVMYDRYIKKNDGTDFLIHKDDIKTIWNSEYLQSIRKKMSAGEWPEDCRYCQSMEDKNILSPRLDYNKNWEQKIGKNYNKILLSEDSYAEHLPISLEPRPGILCDLSCHSCWSLSSSKVFAERQKILKRMEPPPDELKNIVNEWRQEIELAKQSDFAWSNKPQYIENIQECAPSLKRLYFTGGEPTLIESNKKLIKKIKEVGNFECLVSFTTNLNFSDKSFFKELEGFDKVEVTGSIDSLGTQNEYIRYPSSWDKTKENIDFIISLPKVDFSVMTVLSVFNVIGFVDMVDYFSQEKKYSSINFITTLIQGPSHLTLKAVPNSIREKSMQKISQLLSKGSVNTHNQSELKKLKHILASSEDYSPTLNKQFKNYINFIDKERGTDFFMTFPELKEI